MMIQSNYCLQFFEAEYDSLEDYQVKHRRDIGKYLKPKKSPMRSRPLGMFSLVAGFVALVACNCVAWTVMRY